jgi:calcium homeostasis ER protein
VKKLNSTAMAMPPRPVDTQLATIIDRLAEFVARNGPEFEKMTIIKQQNNDRFNFLQPGEIHNDYYQSKVMEERRKIIGKLRPLFDDPVCYRRFSLITTAPQQLPNNSFPPQQQASIWTTTASGNNNGNSHSAAAVQVNIAAQLEEISTQQMRLREQLMESEKNLNAQHQVLL